MADPQQEWEHTSDTAPATSEWESTDTEAGKPEAPSAHAPMYPQWLKDMAVGAQSGALSTIFHGGDLIRRTELAVANALGVPVDKIPPHVRNFVGLDRPIERPEVQQAITPPDTFAGKAGKFIEQGAEFAIPLGEVSTALKGASLPVRLGTESALSGGLTALQTGGDVPETIAGAAIPPAVGAAGAGIAAGARATAIPLWEKLIQSAPRPLSRAATDLAQRFDIPLTSGMAGGSRTVQSVEKLLGHTVAPDIYEPLLEEARTGVTRGARTLSSDFVTDQYTAGQNTVDRMLGKANDLRSQAQQEYKNLARIEADPANIREVQVGTRAEPSSLSDPQGNALPAQQIPVTQKMGLPTDMRPVKQAVAQEVDEVMQRMTPAQRRADPGLTALQNILKRPDYLPASVAEADLGYLKDIMRSESTPQAKRLAAIAADSLSQQVDNAVSIGGQGALDSLHNARQAWAGRSDILDLTKKLAGDVSGKTGQTLLAGKLLRAGDASYPALEQVLKVSPESAEDLGKAYLTDRVFKKAAREGMDFTSPTQAANLWNMIGKRTKAALYTPDQVRDIDAFLELAKRVSENPNPSGTGTMNALLKMGILATHPVAGGSALVFGRNLANVLYKPEGAALVRQALEVPQTDAGRRAGILLKALLTDASTGQTR